MTKIQVPNDIKKQQDSTGKNNPINADKDKEQLELPSDFYDEKSKQYLTYLQVRLESSKQQKTAPHPEFNGKNYYQDYEENLKIATTKLPQKQNDDDVIVSAGTVESKLEALLSHINGLDLTPEIQAFDRENNEITDLGVALTDTMFMTDQIDGGLLAGDEEKKMLRQRELLTQSAVFVQEEWLRTFEMKKKLKGEYKGEYNDVDWSSKLELVFEGPSKTLLYGPNVFLGDITEYYMEKQPYFFVAIQQHYNVAKTKYGKFENWKYVKAGAIPEGTTETSQTIYDNKWRLTSVKENHVEIILYQDKPGDEFQILINGMLMLPIGFPLSAVSPAGEYNVVKQVLKPKHHKFAYGTSFVGAGSIKEIAALIDEMLKLFVLKTRKSYAPPYVNTSGRVISRRVLSAGRISMGFSPDALQPIGTEGNGVTANEYSILKELQDRIDKSTVSSQFAGQQGKSGTTATEVLELQRQSKLTLGLTIAACTLLEKKLGYLRLWNLLENWFNPFNTKVVTVNDVRKYVNQYRKTVRKGVNIEGAGMGDRQIIPFDTSTAGKNVEGGDTPAVELPDEKVIRELEFQAEKETGSPVEMIFLSPQGLKAARLRWFITITPKEKESSAFFKVLFREQLGDMVALMNLGSTPNIEGLEEEFSRVWGKSRNKLFSNQQQVSPELAGVSSNEAQGRANSSGTPNLSALSAVAPGGAAE